MRVYQQRCPCGRLTSKDYARRNGGRCKSCVTGIGQTDRRDSRQGRLIDHGHDACQREDGAYDLPDWA